MLLGPISAANVRVLETSVPLGWEVTDFGHKADVQGNPPGIT